MRQFVRKRGVYFWEYMARPFAALCRRGGRKNKSIKNVSKPKFIWLFNKIWIKSQFSKLPEIWLFTWVTELMTRLGIYSVISPRFNTGKVKRGQNRPISTGNVEWVPKPTKMKKILISAPWVWFAVWVFLYQILISHFYFNFFLSGFWIF